MKIKTQKSKMTLDRLALIIKLELDKKADKDDLKNFATKDDFNVLKKDISGIKDDLKNFATKDEMFTGFDKILGKLDRMEQENIVHVHKHRIIDEALKIRN